jgi:hypothetical protein
MISWDSQNRPKFPNHLHIRQEAAALDIKRQCGGFLYAENRIKRFFIFLKLFYQVKCRLTFFSIGFGIFISETKNVSSKEQEVKDEISGFSRNHSVSWNWHRHSCIEKNGCSR